MCMFQTRDVWPSKQERKGYKVVKVTNFGNLTAPIQGGRYAVGKWNRAKTTKGMVPDGYRLTYSPYRNPGFNVFDNYQDAYRFRCGNPDRQVVRVICRQVVSQSGPYDTQSGFCCMEMFISSEQQNLAILKRQNARFRRLTK